MLVHNWQVEHPQGFNDYSPSKNPQSKTFPDINTKQALNQYFHAIMYTQQTRKGMQREREGIK